DARLPAPRVEDRHRHQAWRGYCDEGDARQCWDIQGDLRPLLWTRPRRHEADRRGGRARSKCNDYKGENRRRSRGQVGSEYLLAFAHNDKGVALNNELEWKVLSQDIICIRSSIISPSRFSVRECSRTSLGTWSACLALEVLVSRH